MSNFPNHSNTPTDGDTSQLGYSTPGGKSKLRTLFILLAILLIGGAAWWYSNPHRDKPIAAQILLNAKLGSEGKLPHTVDSATEFRSALEFAPKETKPSYRKSHTMGNEPTVIGIRSPKPPVLLKNSTDGSISKNSDSSQLEDNVAEEITVSVDEASIDWGGLVLVPNELVLAKAYSSDVQLVRVEAHPIKGDHLRVWARVQNKTDKPLSTAVGCEFENKKNFERPFFKEVVIEPESYIDAYFVSQSPKIHSYTVMVRR